MWLSFENRNWVDVREASRLLQLHPVTIRKYAREGKIKGYKISDAWIISLDEIDRLIDAKGDRSRFRYGFWQKESK